MQHTDKCGNSVMVKGMTKKEYTLYESIHIKLLGKTVGTEDWWLPKNGVG